MANKGFRASCNTAVVTVGDDLLRVAWSGSGICAVELESLCTRRALEHRLKRTLVDAPLPKTIRKTLTAAARGHSEDFPLDLSWARDFEREVLLAAREIPYGQTRSYSWLARTARRPLAVRAAASVMARCPLWRIIPCHRVIYSDGRLGPYGSSGEKRKRALLEREGIFSKPATRAIKKRSSTRPRTTH